MEIRRMVIPDATTAATALIDTFKEAPWNEDWSQEAATSRIKELATGPMAKGFVIYEGDELKACLIGRKVTFLAGKEFIVDEFFVVPEQQNKGYGSAMIDYVKQECEKDGIKYIVLNTEHGHPSDAFCSRNGFVDREDVAFVTKEL